jgi:hypothetical protein
VVSVARTVALGLVLVALVSILAAGAPMRAAHPSAVRLDLDAKDLQRAMSEHHCTTTGFGESASPRSALVRHRGELRHVTFERAWSVFTGAAPGELLAVCLSEVSVGERAVSAGA